jgi:predicted enzyme related to lactoylglutathione lyase
MHLWNKSSLLMGCSMAFLIIISCDAKTDIRLHTEKCIPKSPKTTFMNDTTPKVTGIGGIFFRTKDSKNTKEWYGKNLGLAINDYGSSFEFRNANNPKEINYLQWSTFDENTDYFDPSTKEFMINYRVQNIEGLVKNLKKNGVQVLDEIEAYDYGKFVHIMDPEGNKIELWEPIDSVLTQIGSETTK